MRPALLALPLILGSLASASATGTLVCEADDKSVEFTTGATLGGPRRGMVVNFGGNLDLKSPGKLPPELHKLVLTKEDFSQAWIDGTQVKLQLYRERAERPGAYVSLTIEARRIDEGQYRGRYLLETDVVDKDNVFGTTPRRIRGRATCASD